MFHREIPVFLFTGFLESGKSTFILDTLHQDYFATGERTLIIACEEGETEYDKSELRELNTYVEYIENEEDITKELLASWNSSYKPRRVLIEYNGMWDVNEILEDVIIPEIFHTLYEVKSTQKSEDVDMVLLREPKDSGYYEFSANDELVITKGHNNFTPKEEAKSFHADTYCFDSKPEKECFLQYISSNKVKEIYFTGMFTSNQGDLSVQYYDPESKRLRKYYPDFLALMEDGSYQLIEVKGDNKIDDEVVLAKKAAAEEMAVASGVHYLMYAGSTLMKSNVLEPTLVVQQASIDI
mgnify:CR=1 FL=1